jgi:hypothetical protein
LDLTLITNCNICGNYTVKVGQEILGARTMIAKLRLDLKDNKNLADIHARSASIRGLKLEIEMLLEAIHMDDVLPTAARNQSALAVVA